ncbi:helix-turn-helix domain-containing protein [Limnovirga soli]|uniref:Helix-turn-helix domain-containing protein n=1 Tax=Limnovirga soli TaxID=2656915 RepID=A0A8J8JRR0_9BACT|nr:helix-turn-helix transcriptional regulator [Limnovirga soli]NNV53883.1 helix-turn-helix domain-containing protein [Limnovirga soli]
METKHMYGSKIKAFRMMRGFSQEDMAGRLDITQATYSKIEGNKQRANADQLEKIAKELGVTIADITSNEPIVILNNASNHGAQGHIENFYADQKELYEKLVASKDDEIKSLKEMIQTLKDLVGSFGKKN